MAAFLHSLARAHSLYLLRFFFGGNPKASAWTALGPATVFQIDEAICAMR